MRMREDVIEITVNGKSRPRVTLNKECPVYVSYIENTDYSKHLAKGLSEDENLQEVLKRSAIAFFDACMETLDELEEIDPQAAEEVLVDLGLEDFFEENEDTIYLGQSVYCTPNALKRKR